MNESNLEFGLAGKEDIDAAVALYKAAVGGDGCSWDEEYPSRETAEADLAAGGLYTLRLDGKIIGAVSVAPENELDGLGCFTVREKAREFARITVSPPLRGKGYAAYMLRRLTESAKSEGVSAWHILVSVANPSAIALYRSFGFEFLGECEAYGGCYYICEKVLGEKCK